jgi:hypothetical protein
MTTGLAGVPGVNAPGALSVIDAGGQVEKKPAELAALADGCRDQDRSGLVGGGDTILIDSDHLRSIGGVGALNGVQRMPGQAADIGLAGSSACEDARNQLRSCSLREAGVGLVCRGGDRVHYRAGSSRWIAFVLQPGPVRPGRSRVAELLGSTKPGMVTANCVDDNPAAKTVASLIPLKKVLVGKSC